MYTPIGDEGCLEGEPTVHAFIQFAPILVEKFHRKCKSRKGYKFIQSLIAFYIVYYCFISFVIDRYGFFNALLLLMLNKLQLNLCVLSNRAVI